MWAGGLTHLITKITRLVSRPDPLGARETSTVNRRGETRYTWIREGDLSRSK